MNKTILFILITVCTFFSTLTDAQSSTYKNPVIAGDFPDPTIIRVKNTYYAAGTSSDFAPHYPLYQSKDLINWVRIGSCLMETPKWASGSFWAPELFYNKGVYYLYYTAKRKSDNVSCIGVATTTDLSKGFRDKGIIINWGQEAIDAFVFKDSDGKLYICWKAYGLNKDRPIEILASELSTDGLSLIGPHFSLTRYDEGWKGAGDEGPCLMKKNGYYYLFYSVGGCCDSRCTYRLMVSRSKNLKTGWKQYAENPILEGGDDWKCSGHGTLVETANQRYFLLYHAYNAKDFEYVGRQGMLDEMVWDKKSGWPYFKNGKTPSSIAQTPFKRTVQLRDSVYTDHFTSATSLKLWQWDLNSPKPEIQINGGQLSLSSIEKGLIFSGISPQTGTYSFEAELKERTSGLSGICIYGGQMCLLAFVADRSKLVLFRIKDGERKILCEIPNNERNLIVFKTVAKNGRFFKFFWSNNRIDWYPVKLDSEYFDGEFLPNWGVAMRVGVFIENTQNESAKFSFVQLINKFN